MTVLLLLTVVGLLIVNWWQRRCIRQLHVLLVEQLLLLQKTQGLAEGTPLEADAPTVTYTLN